MTALSGPILFNNSTGSDTAASGCGPATAIAISIQLGAGTNTTMYASWSGTISAGDLVYYNTSTGRKFNVVASATNTGTQSITFDDNWDDSLYGTAYCGGKRATFDNADSRIMFSQDSKSDWSFETETDQTISSMLQFYASKDIYGTTKYKSIINTSSSASMSLRYPSGYVSNLHFKCTNATKGAAFQDGYSGYGGGICLNCKFGDTTDTISSVSAASGGGNGAPTLYDCVITNTTSNGFYSDNSLTAINTTIDGCGGSGVAPAGNASVTLLNCIVSNNTSHGVLVSSGNGTGGCVINNCIFYNNGADGINLLTNARPSRIMDSLFVSNGGYGINANASANNTSYSPSNVNLAFFGNSSGDANSYSIDRNRITLTADPFVSASTGDFNISDSAGGGATLRSTNYTIGG